MLTKVFLPPPDAKSLGQRCTFTPDIYSRLLVSAAVQVVGTKTSGVGTAPLAAVDVIEYVLVLQDGVEKMRIDPTLQAVYDNILNSNDDTLDASYVTIPFYRRGQVWSLWGTADIARIQIVVKLLPLSSCPAGTALTDLRGLWGYNSIATPQPRGRAFVQGLFTWTKTVAGWNEISDLAYDGISAISTLILGSQAITQVEVYIGDSMKYQLLKQDAFAVLQRNDIYKAPADYAAATYFPVVFDDYGLYGDLLGLLDNGVRRPLKIRFYWDTSIAAVASFNILAEAVEEAKTTGVATAKA